MDYLHVKPRGELDRGQNWEEFDYVDNFILQAVAPLTILLYSEGPVCLSVYLISVAANVPSILLSSAQSIQPRLPTSIQLYKQLY